MINRVREIRQEKGMTQVDLSAKAGISRPHLSEIERGNAVPSVIVAGIIAKNLDSTVDYVFALKNGSEPDESYSLEGS